MRNFIALALPLIISSSALACTNVKLLYKGETITLCHFKSTDSYLSKNCRDIGRCFLKEPVTLKGSPQQSPGFALCYQIQGEPFFGEIQGLKEKIPLCKKGDFIADQERILYHYKSLKR